jgi:hypothetical protein
VTPDLIPFDLAITGTTLTTINADQNTVTSYIFAPSQSGQDITLTWQNYPSGVRMILIINSCFHSQCGHG